MGQLLVVATPVIMAKHDTARTDPWSYDVIDAEEIRTWDQWDGFAIVLVADHWSIVVWRTLRVYKLNLASLVTEPRPQATSNKLQA